MPAVRLPYPYTAAGLQALSDRFGSPLLVIDCDIIRRQYHALAAALPGVDLHYALKPLPDATVVQVLAREGAWFDLATNGEVDLVRDAGIDAARCIQTHPIKRDSDIRHALEFGITTFVIDNPDEIAKFEQYRERVRLLVRVAFRSPEAIVDLSRKFGCDADAALDLAGRAATAGIRVSGFSFHVGSQVARPDMYVQAIETCAGLIAESRRLGLGPIEVLDIGGGFPIDYLQPAPAISEFCAPIRRALAMLPAGLRTIAEPGRFICGPAGVGLTTVIGRAHRDDRWWYYLDDGLYGTFSGQLYDHSRLAERLDTDLGGSGTPTTPPTLCRCRASPPASVLGGSGWRGRQPRHIESRRQPRQRDWTPTMVVLELPPLLQRCADAGRPRRHQL
jgi:ornithine decarboxylase